MQRIRCMFILLLFHLLSRLFLPLHSSTSIVIIITRHQSSMECKIDPILQYILCLTCSHLLASHFALALLLYKCGCRARTGVVSLLAHVYNVRIRGYGPLAMPCRSGCPICHPSWLCWWDVWPSIPKIQGFECCSLAWAWRICEADVGRCEACCGWQQGSCTVLRRLPTTLLLQLALTSHVAAARRRILRYIIISSSSQFTVLYSNQLATQVAHPNCKS